MPTGRAARGAWIAAGRARAGDGSARVARPECGGGPMTATDPGAREAPVSERWIGFADRGARDVIRMRRRAVPTD